MINEVQAETFRSRAIYVPKTKIEQKVSFLTIYFEVLGKLGREFIIDLANTVTSRLETAAESAATRVDRDEERQLKKADPEYFHKEALASIPEDDRPLVSLLRQLADGENAVLEYLWATHGGPSASDEARKRRAEIQARSRRDPGAIPAAIMASDGIG